MAGVHAAFAQKIRQKHAVRADAPGVIRLRARARQRHRLIHPLAAHVQVVPQRVLRLPHRDKVIHLIHVIHVQRPKIQNFHSSVPPWDASQSS